MQDGYLNVFSPFFFLCMGMAFLFSGCVKQSAKSSEETIADQPVSISGRPIVLSYDNARVRCNFADGKSFNEYELLCRAVIIDEQGNELLAVGKAPGIELNWSEPEKKDGAEVLSQTCITTENDLSQRCQIRLARGFHTRLVTELIIMDTINNRERSESDETLLPFSIISYGFMPQIPLSYALIPSKVDGDLISLSGSKSIKKAVGFRGLQSQNIQSEEEVAIPAGFQIMKKDPREVEFASFENFCVDGDEFYFVFSRYHLPY